jgi:hypothetical protein
MDIAEMKVEQVKAQDEIRDAIQPILEQFAAKTGLVIENVFVHMCYTTQEVKGQHIYTVDEVTCEVKC